MGNKASAASLFWFVVSVRDTWILFTEHCNPAHENNMIKHIKDAFFSLFLVIWKQLILITLITSHLKFLVFVALWNGTDPINAVFLILWVRVAVVAVVEPSISPGQRGGVQYSCSESWMGTARPHSTASKCMNRIQDLPLTACWITLSAPWNNNHTAAWEMKSKSNTQVTYKVS